MYREHQLVLLLFAPLQALRKPVQLRLLPSLETKRGQRDDVLFIYTYVYISMTYLSAPSPHS